MESLNKRHKFKLSYPRAIVQQRTDVAFQPSKTALNVLKNQLSQLLYINSYLVPYSKNNIRVSFSTYETRSRGYTGCILANLRSSLVAKIHPQTLSENVSISG